jgi:dihydrofolate reductase
MSFNIILATDKDYGIAKDHKIPWYYPEDLKHFNSITSGHIIIMGRNTADELKKALPNRINIVITSLESYGRDRFITVASLDAALRVANEIRLAEGKEIFICGGRSIYNECFKSDKIKKIYYTHINKSYGCNIFVNCILNNPNMMYSIIKKSLIDEVELTYYEIESKYEML